MAKTGFWLRGAKGKLAGSTIYRGKGGTVMREIVSPTNPKTKKQMRQRAIFATCVKFFKHANQRFFKFAFEDKKQAESDYNAFVRHNIQRSTIYMYEASQNEAFPALSNWQLTQGSLSAANCTPNGDRLRLYAEGISTDMTKLGQVWEKVIAAYNLQAGDIITLVAIRSVVQSIEETDVTTTPAWDTYQFILDPADTTALGDVFSTGDGYLTMETSMDPDDACAVAVCFSRNIAGGGLKVSNSYLVLNDTAEGILEASQEDAYREQAINSWGATGEAILQGSLVQ